MSVVDKGSKKSNRQLTKLKKAKDNEIENEHMTF